MNSTDPTPADAPLDAERLAEIKARSNAQCEDCGSSNCDRPQCVQARDLLALLDSHAALQASLDRLSEMKFSERAHAALQYRAKRAEQRVRDLEAALDSYAEAMKWHIKAGLERVTALRGAGEGK